jgi:hypothetical protein
MKDNKFKKYIKYFFREERYVNSLKRTFTLINEDLKEIEFKLVNVRYDKDIIVKVWNLEFSIARTLKEFNDVDFWTKGKYYKFYEKFKKYERELIVIRKLNDILNDNTPRGQRFIPIDPFGEEIWEDD